MKTLTGFLDTDILILLELNDVSLSKICQVNKYTQKLCQNERLWQGKVRRKFGSEIIMHKPLEITYREQYISLKTINLRPSSHNEIIKIVNDKRYDIILANLNYFINKDPYTILTYTASSGDLELLKFLYQLNIIKFNGLGNVIDQAAAGGNIDMVKFLLEKGDKPSDNTVDRAIYNDHFKLVKWFIKHNILPSGLGLRNLSEKGHNDILKWIKIKLEKLLNNADVNTNKINFLLKFIEKYKLDDI